MKTILPLLFTLLLTVGCKSRKAVTENLTAESDTLPAARALGQARMVYFPDLVNPIPDTSLENFMEFEFIDKKLYDRKQKSAIDYLEKAKPEENSDFGVTLLCDSMAMLFPNDTTSNETHREYYLLGEIPKLNRFVVSAMYYEDYEIKLIEKATCEELVLTDYPYISADMKHLLTVFLDVYSGSTIIGLYKISGQEISNMLYASIDTWQPAIDERNLHYPMFFARDNYFYMAIRQTEGGRDSFKKAVGPVLYIRIKM